MIRVEFDNLTTTVTDGLNLINTGVRPVDRVFGLNVVKSAEKMGYEVVGVEVGHKKVFALTKV